MPKMNFVLRLHTDGQKKTLKKSSLKLLKILVEDVQKVLKIKYKTFDKMCFSFFTSLIFPFFEGVSSPNVIRPVLDTSPSPPFPCFLSRLQNGIIVQSYKRMPVYCCLTYKNSYGVLSF